MPKRVIDFDAMWASDKLAACAEWAQAEYAWLYGLADANGSFELTNVRVIWGRVAAIRKNLPLEQLEQILDEFAAKGLLFIWSENGKRYGHWTNSDLPGRLPAPSWRARLERLAPPVPRDQLARYMQQFARSELKRGFESPQAERVEEGREQEEEGEPECGAETSLFAYSGTHLRVTQRQDQLLGEAFPWVERRAEYAKVDSWLEANSNRRPRKTGRFLHHWFARIDAPGNVQRAGLCTSAVLRQAQAGLAPNLQEGRVKPEHLERLRERQQQRAAGKWPGREQ